MASRGFTESAAMRPQRTHAGPEFGAACGLPQRYGDCYFRSREVCTHIEMPAGSDNLSANLCQADVTAFNAST